MDRTGSTLDLIAECNTCGTDSDGLGECRQRNQYGQASEEREAVHSRSDLHQNTTILNWLLKDPGPCVRAGGGVSSLRQKIINWNRNLVTALTALSVVAVF